MTENRSLLDIEADMQALDDLLFEAGGDITDPKVEEYVTNLLGENEAALRAKSDGYARYIHELQARAAAANDQAERLKSRAKTATNQADWLKSRLKSVMELRGIKKIEGQYATVGIRGNGGKTPMNVDENATLPDAFTIVVRNPDNEKIRAALEAGQKLPFASLGERGTHLSIR